MFGAAIMRRMFVRHASPGDALRDAGTISAAGHAKRISGEIRGKRQRAGSEGVRRTGWTDWFVVGPRSTPTQVMRRISRSMRGRAAASARSCPMAAELSTLGSSTLLRVKSCGSQERSDRCRRRVSLEP